MRQDQPPGAHPFVTCDVCDKPLRECMHGRIARPRGPIRPPDGDSNGDAHEAVSDSAVRDDPPHRVQRELVADCSW